ncbi:MAG: PBSX family phage terminase large subunit [Eubacteriaceae bacterium]|nr:PBSX family phage terminase large subunit [Eubacteriaceae bacterium]
MNPSFAPLFKREERYLVLMGGAGSGKSMFAGRKLLERMTCEPAHRFLVVRKVARTLRESCYKQLISQIGENFEAADFKIGKADMSITHKNGSEIIFAGLDDVYKLKSIYRITGIWVEEASEITEEEFNQLDIRLRGESAFYKQIILSFNPVSINHWLKARFFDSPARDAFVHCSNYKDNLFLDERAVRVLEDYRETDPYYYAVYCLGQWGVMGQTVFPQSALAKRLEEMKREKKPLRGEFAYRLSEAGLIESYEFIPFDKGPIAIYDLPRAGRGYVMGADTAGEGSDLFACQLIGEEGGEQCAVLHGKFDEDIFAAQLYCLGKFYNNALAAVEANFSTYPIMELERLKYPNQYVREKTDDFTHSVVKSYGFKTTSATRPPALAALIAAFRRNPEIIKDEATLGEMMSFVRNENGRAQASGGSHDDLVMSLAIAHFVLPERELPQIKRPERKPNFSFEKVSPGVLGVGEKIKII